MARDCTPSRRVLLSMTAVVVVLTGVSVLVAQHPSSSVAGFLEVASGHALQLAPTHHVPPSSVDGASHAGDTIPLAVGVNSPMFLELHSASRPVTTPGLPTTSGGGSSNVLFPLADTLMPFANPYDAINVAALLPKIATRGTTADTVATVDSFAWSPGGVRGASRHEVDAVLDKLFRDARSASEIRQALCAASSTPVRGLITSLAQSLAVLDTTSDIGGDCRYHLTPMQRATCIGMALADDEADEVPLHDRRAYRESNCRVLAPCADWARGRFSTPLSAELLDRVYEDVVVPSVHQHADAVQAFSRQFLHGEGNFEELKWLMRRSKAMDEDLRKRNRKAGRLKANKASTEHNMSTPTAMRDVFQGRPLTVANDTLQAVVFSAVNPAGERRDVSTIPALPSLAVLAVLHRMIGPALDGDGDAGGVLNVMTFNGDSVNREVFHRLIHHIRFGDDRRPLQRAGNERYFPHFHYATHYDMVYVVHPTHDELLGFHSPQTNGSSTYTVEGYFREVRRNVTRWREAGGRGAGAEASAPVALMYVVWYWDPFTSMPRPCAFGAEEAGPFAEHGDGDAALATASGQGALSRIGVRASVLVQGTAFWERVQGAAVMDRLKATVMLEARAKRPRHVYLLTAPCEDLTNELVDPPLPLRDPSYANNAANPSLSGSANRLGPDDVVDPATQHYNLNKNVYLFHWLFNGTSPLFTVAPLSSAPMARATLQLLDKAKAQFVGEPLRDKLHFTCRVTYAYAKPRFFDASMSAWSMTRLLLPPLTHRGVFGGASVPNATRGDASAPRAVLPQWCSNGPRIRDVHAVGRWWFRLLKAPSVRVQLWTLMQLEHFRIRGSVVTGVLLPRAVLWNRHGGYVAQVQGLGDDLRLPGPQVYVNFDAHRLDCSDDVDGLLLRGLLASYVIRRSEVPSEGNVS